MTLQTLILPKVSPKKCYFFTELCICEKIIGRVSYSMDFVKKQRADRSLRLPALWTFILLLVYCDNALIYFWLNTLSN